MIPENLEKPEIKNLSKKFSYGKWLFIFAVFSWILGNIEENIVPHSLSSLAVSFVTILRILLDAGTAYFLVLWIIDLIRRRGGIERPENKKVRLVVNIIFAIIFLLMIVSVFMVLFNFYETK